MKGRENRAPAATDLLVCFPSRAHLSLLPKAICSPARPPESSSALHRHRRRPSHHQLWAKSKQNNNNSNNNADDSEPSSPKVTCAGQIKVRRKPNSCKNWQSVMEEIERLHNHRKNKKKGNWVEAFGFKRDVMQFLTCLRNIRFDFRCFGAVPASDVASDDDDDDDDQDSSDVFSKWFTILQEDNSRGKVIRPYCDDDDEEDEQPAAAEGAPPPNALLLMRCRSAPAKSWLEEREEERRGGERGEEADLCEVSCEIGKEMISRSRSWRR
ncbi:hypothetical protein ACS0TY_013246 [Phlomoides rotata]